MVLIYLKNHQLSEADWKIKIAVRTPTSAVTAKATVGKGDVSPKFCKIKMAKGFLR